MLRIAVLLSLAVCLSLGAPEPPQFPPEARAPLDRFLLVKPYNRWMSKYNTLGAVLTTMNEVRLTNDKKGVIGGIWARQPLGLDAFTVEARLRISSSSSLYADGMGIWFTERATIGGAYGISPMFTGFGVVLDIYDNQHARNTPFLALVASNGTNSLNNDNNGKAHTLESCRIYESNSFIRDGRDHNAHESVAVHIEYVPGKIRIFYKQERDLDWQHCITRENIYIPNYFLLGVSASTGDLAAQQDLLSLKVFDVPIDVTVKARSTMHFDQGGVAAAEAAGEKMESSTVGVATVLFFSFAFLLVAGALIIIIKPDLLPGTQASIDRQKRFY